MKIEDAMQEVQDLALSEMTIHGLTRKGWTFAFDKAKRRRGCCKCHKKQITVSIYHLRDWPDNRSDVRETILHEIAHGLCDDNEGHGPEWKRTAQRIGATPSRATCVPMDVPYLWTGACTGRTHQAHRKRRRAVYKCKCCGSEIKWRSTRGH